MSEINDYEVICDFCNKKRTFAQVRQVTLKIEKQNKHQHLLATMCEECETDGAKKTVYGQYVKESHKLRDEKSIFDKTEETI